VQRDRRDEGGGGVCAGAPDFVPGDDFGAAEMTAAEMRGVVLDRDVRAGERDGRGGGGTGHRFAVLRRHLGRHRRGKCDSTDGIGEGAEEHVGSLSSYWSVGADGFDAELRRAGVSTALFAADGPMLG
jgi:hypothetical protein